jgi:hypothetical protein
MSREGGLRWNAPGLREFRIGQVQPADLEHLNPCRGKKPVSTSAIGKTDQIALTISRKYGETLIGALRKSYGCNFAPHCADDEKLGNVLHKMDVASLTDLMRDHRTGKLAQICRG